MVWGINEFFERGEDAKRLGLSVAKRLLDTGDRSATNVIVELCRLRPALRGALEGEGYSVTDEGNEAEAFNAREVGAMAHILANAGRRLGGKGSLDLFWSGEIEGLINNWDAAFSGEQGIRAMTAMKRILRHICGVLTEMRLTGSLSTEEITGLTSKLCREVLDRINLDPNKSAFLAIESLEIVRDKHPEGCVRAMSDYLPIANRELVQGIFVCMAEGLEDLDQRYQFLPFMREFRAHVLALQDTHSPSGPIEKGLEWFDQRIRSNPNLADIAVELFELATSSLRAQTAAPADNEEQIGGAESRDCKAEPASVNLGKRALEHLDSLYGFAVTLTHDRTEAEDLVQETCLRAFRALERRPPDENVKGWLFVIMRNTWLNQIRDSNRGPKFVELESADTEEREIG
ncbi:MAG: RNA polymerase sigma factor, partial [Blastocatellia bacterium]